MPGELPPPPLSFVLSSGLGARRYLLDHVLKVCRIKKFFSTEAAHVRMLAGQIDILKGRELEAARLRGWRGIHGLATPVEKFVSGAADNKRFFFLITG
ncbi:unnamed protein product [Calypogeia fissa]